MFLLHASTDGSVLTAWTFEPLPTVPVWLLGIAYFAAYRAARPGRRRPGRWRVAAFYLGLFAFWTALAGPPGVWNDELFFLHMLQHLLMILVAPPLLLLGRPVQLFLQAAPPVWTGRILRPVLRRGWLRGTLTVLTHPASVATIFNANLVLWHIPGAYELALDNVIVHELEHLAFYATAMLFWWTVIDPVPRHHRLSDHWLLGVSFATCMVGSLIAAVLTLSPRVIYSHYQESVAPWGLSPLTDQHIGGGIMWISGFVYFALMFYTLYRVVQPASESGAQDRVATA